MGALYQIRSFTDVADWGEGLWSFLNEQQIVGQMENASDQGRPAVEAIARKLHRRFGEGVRKDRVKQFIGFLVRQVMERRGYVHHSYGHQARENPVFSTGSRYVRGND